MHQALQAQEPTARLAGLDQVIAAYPDTATAVIALEKKARLLAGQRSFQDAEAALTYVLARLRPTVPDSDYFQATRAGYRQLLYEAVQQDLRERKAVPEDRYAQLRAACSEVASADRRPDEAAWAATNLIETYSWQHRYPECIDMAERFLAEHPPAQYSVQCVEVRFFAAIAAQELARFDTGYAHLRWITDQSGLDLRSDVGRRLLPHVYHRIWLGLSRSGAAPQEVAAAKQQMDAVVEQARQLNAAAQQAKPAQ